MLYIFVHFFARPEPNKLCSNHQFMRKSPRSQRGDFQHIRPSKNFTIFCRKGSQILQKIKISMKMFYLMTLLRQKCENAPIFIVCAKYTGLKIQLRLAPKRIKNENFRHLHIFPSLNIQKQKITNENSGFFKI